MSPPQYQKQIRLQEARRLLLLETSEGADVGFQVGYESPTQFNREYARMFGLPPIRDIKRLRESLDLGLGRSRPDWNRQLTERFRQTQKRHGRRFSILGIPCPVFCYFPIPSFRPAPKPLDMNCWERIYMMIAGMAYSTEKAARRRNRPCHTARRTDRASGKPGTSPATATGYTERRNCPSAEKVNIATVQIPEPSAAPPPCAFL